MAKNKNKISRNNDRNENKHGIQRLKYDVDEKSFNIDSFIKPFIKRNEKQQKVYNDLKTHKVNFVLGRVGSGKTRIAVHSALEDLFAGKYKKIFLLRPTVTTEESLGFLGGSKEDKVQPYIISLLDPIEEILGTSLTNSLIEKKQIVIDAIGFYRGRSIKNSIILVDEVQNMTKNQLRMMLTRLEDSSKIILMGDSTQCDLRNKDNSASHYFERFINKPMISFNAFSKDEIVRGELTKIIDSCFYDLNDNTLEDDYEKFFLNKETEVYEYQGKYE